MTYLLSLYFTLLSILIINIFATTNLALKTDHGVLLSSTCDFSIGGTMLRSDYNWIECIGDNVMILLNGDSVDCNTVLEALKSAERDYKLNMAESCYEITNNMNLNDKNLKYNHSISPKNLAYLCRKIIADVLRSKPLNVNALVAGWDHNKKSRNSNNNGTIKRISHIKPVLKTKKDDNTETIGKDKDIVGDDHDHDNGSPVLYTIDRLASMREVPFAVHASGPEFLTVLSIMDMAFGADTGATISSSSISYSSLNLNSDSMMALESLKSKEEGLRVIKACWKAIRTRSTSGNAHLQVNVKCIGPNGFCDVATL